MTIDEIKGLTRFLSEEEVEQIKKQIKNKEDILKSGNLEEEEMIQVLNTLFAVLVIEKTLESEIEGVEEIRDELEQELLECYEVYDSYMIKYKKEEKKNKKNWLLHFLGLSEDISSKRKNISATTATINKLQGELNTLKQQRSNENLSNVVSKQDKSVYDSFCDCPGNHRHPRRGEPPFIRERMEERRPSTNHRNRHEDRESRINSRPPREGQDATRNRESDVAINERRNRSSDIRHSGYLKPKM